MERGQRVLRNADQVSELVKSVDTVIVDLVPKIQLRKKQTESEA